MTTTTSLTLYDRVQDPWQFCRDFGTAMAKSRFFGCSTAEQGMVLAMAAMAENENPISLARRFHVIDGTLSMKADAMLAAFRQLGGRHKIVSCTPDLATVELAIGDETHTESLSWEEAKQEPFPYGKGGELKTNWATPRARKQMLWARVISEAVRRLRPEINSGVYTPEESADFVQVEVVEPKPTPTAAELLQQQAQKAQQAAKPSESDVPKRTASGTQKQQPQQSPQATPSQQQQQQPGTIGSLDDDGEIVDAEFEVKDDQVGKPPAANAPCTEHQRQLIEQAFESLEMTGEQREKAIQKRGGQVLRNLTVAAAEDLLQALTDAMGKKVVGDSQVPPEHEQAAHRMHEATPCPQEYADQIKRRLGDLSDPEFMTRLKKHLAVYGKSKLTELTYGDAQRLMVALEQEVAGDWLSHPLVRLDEEGNVVEPGRQ